MFWVFLSPFLVFFSHTCANEYPAEYLRETLCRSLEFSLCEALSSLLPRFLNCSHHSLPWLLALSPQLRSQPTSSLVFLSPTIVWKHSENSKVVSACFPFRDQCPLLLRVQCLEKYCLIYFIFIVALGGSKFSKSSTCYSILARSKNPVFNLYVTVTLKMLQTIIYHFANYIVQTLLYYKWWFVIPRLQKYFCEKELSVLWIPIKDKVSVSFITQNHFLCNKNSILNDTIQLQWP